MKKKYATYRWRKYELRTYDVWGNAKDGFEVNDVFKNGTVKIKCWLKVYNEDTPQEFVSYDPTDRQLAVAVGVKYAEWDGDDEHLYATDKRNGKPLCELHLIKDE